MLRVSQTVARLASRSCRSSTSSSLRHGFSQTGLCAVVSRPAQLTVPSRPLLTMRGLHSSSRSAAEEPRLNMDPTVTLASTEARAAKLAEKKAAAVRDVSEAVACVQLTANNTIVTITDIKGERLRLSLLRGGQAGKGLQLRERGRWWKQGEKGVGEAEAQGGI